MGRLIGYNIRLKLTDKELLAVTQNDLTIAAVIKESITKDDLGVTQLSVANHDVTFKVSGLLEVQSSATTKLGRDEVMALALQEGDSASFAVEYIGDTGAAYTGTAIITQYTESAGANPQDDPTFGLDMRLTSKLVLKSS